MTHCHLDRHVQAHARRALAHRGVAVVARRLAREGIGLLPRDARNAGRRRRRRAELNAVSNARGSIIDLLFLKLLNISVLLSISLRYTPRVVVA